MPQDNFYYVFEPDQVLTEQHLNQLFAYLDGQEHLTRNKLIGIGIVCGLQTSVSNAEITITKGVGITSLGYLLQFDGGIYTRYRAYTVPDFPETIAPSVHATYASWQMRLLVAADAPKQAGDVALQGGADILKTHAVVLFLEPLLMALKNCTTEDCNDKGKRVDITVRPVLVQKEILQRYKNFNLQQQKFNFPQVHLKRWNVPAQNMQHPVNVVQAFDTALSSALLREIAAACKFMYDVFHPVLNVTGDDSLNHVFSRLLTLINSIRQSHTVYYQYLYDYADDIIKAYNDFQEVIFDVLSECCPDENLFPLHLMLGEAGNSSANNNTAYRNYFIYSPLFNGQREKLEQATMYYKRMLYLLDDFELPLTSTQSLIANRAALNIDIRITPSLLGDYPLSKRCIPYYYKPEPLFQYWDYEKSRRGKAALNHGYFADAYSNDAANVQPLLYDTEPYNFFRIEGHAGREVNTVLRNIVQQKLQYNLPFDVVALNLYAGSTMQERDKLKCYFNDLESTYNVLISEMLCKFHGLYCAAGKWAFNKAIFESVFGRNDNMATKGFTAAATPGAATKEASVTEGTSATADADIKLEGNTLFKSFAADFDASLATLSVAATSFVDRVRKVVPYGKGSYMRYFCKPEKKETVATYYLNWLPANKGKRWPKPSAIPPGDVNVQHWMAGAYTHIFYLIDSIEELLGRILPFDLNELNYNRFKLLYDEVMAEVEAYADYFDNLYNALDMINDQKDLAAQKPVDHIQEEFEDWLVDKLVVNLKAECRGIMMMCVDDQVQQLQYEYKKRVAYILEQHIFSNYVKLKSGLEHKAGVPKGGTFVLLYFEKPDVVKGTNLSSVTNRSDVAVVADKGVEAALENESAAATISTAKTKLTDAEKLQKNITGLQQIIENNKEEFGEPELAAATLLLGKISTLPASVQTLRIPEGVVFADLYIPYMCCSDCAPTAYVFQQVKEEEPQPDINIRRTFFCNNEEVKEPLTIKPEGGTVSGQGLIQEGANYFFSPKGLAEGDYVIQYKLAAKTDSITVTVKAVYDPEFGFAEKGINPASGGTIVAFNATAQQGQHQWNFGDNTPLSTEINPQHVYLFTGNESVFNVTHTITNGNCTLPPLSKQVNLRRENPVTLSIKKNPLCTKDKPELLMYNPGNGNMTCKENAQAIQQVGGTFAFAPQVSGEGKFTVIYDAAGFSKQISIEVQATPEAAFSSKIINRSANGTTVQFASVTKNATHEWKFSDGQSSTEADPKIQFNPVPTGSNFIKATHTVSGKVCSADLVKDIALTPEIITSAIKICYGEKEITLEPNLADDNIITLLDAAGQQLSKRAQLQLSPAIQFGTTTFTVRYLITTADKAVEKRVTVTVSRLDERVIITSNSDGISLKCPVEKISWTISVNNGQTRIIKQSKANPLFLKRQTEAPVNVEIAFIIAATTEGGDCASGFTKVILAKTYNPFMNAVNGLIEV